MSNRVIIQIALSLKAVALSSVEENLSEMTDSNDYIYISVYIKSQFLLLTFLASDKFPPGQSRDKVSCVSLILLF